jgi:glycine/D-amino acid oxidase-like deaminating enzyme
MRVAILGAGIMGTCLALLLARRGVAVTVFDKEPEPLACASRWNEGKIHLGYLYGADPSLNTARQVIPGGLAFAHLVAELIGEPVDARTTPDDDVVLIHRDSVLTTDAVAPRFDAISALIREHPNAGAYLRDAARAQARRLSNAELNAIADSDTILAGFEVPERSVDTQWLADRLAAALRAEPRIELRLSSVVASSRPVTRADGRWRIGLAAGAADEYDVVVNALWEGRLAVDVTAGLEPEAEWSHRYRLCAFVRTRLPLAVRSAVVAIGPFGDVKNYNGQDFYLSWYPAGLRLESEAIAPGLPAPITQYEERALVRDVHANLARLMPPTAQVLAHAEDIKVRGGFVFAQGRGSLADARSTLHRRDRFGLRRLGNYYSVDTGKYSTAPWLARRVAEEICNG